jgi:hypothetical protein
VTQVCAQCLIDGAVPVFSTRIRHQNEGSEVSIYFTFELLETRAGHTGLAVVVDKFSKDGHFLYTLKRFTVTMFYHQRSFPTETQDLRPSSGIQYTSS